MADLNFPVTSEGQCEMGSREGARGQLVFGIPALHTAWPSLMGILGISEFGEWRNPEELVWSSQGWAAELSVTQTHSLCLSNYYLLGELGDLISQ